MAKQYHARPITDWAQLPVIMTLEEVTAVMRVSKPTVLKYINSGAIKAARLENRILVNKENLIKFLDGEKKIDLSRLVEERNESK